MPFCWDRGEHCSLCPIVGLLARLAGAAGVGLRGAELARVRVGDRCGLTLKLDHEGTTGRVERLERCSVEVDLRIARVGRCSSAGQNRRDDREGYEQAHDAPSWVTHVCLSPGFLTPPA